MLRRGEIIETLLLQNPYDGVPTDVQVPLLALAFSSFFDSRDQDFIEKNRGALVEALSNHEQVQHLRTVAFDTMELNEYLLQVEKTHNILNSVCQQ